MNKKTPAAATSVLIALATIPVAARAQSGYIRPSYEFPGATPGAMQVANTPMFFSPYVGVGAAHDDNLFFSNANRKGSAIYMLSPGFRLDARDPNKVLQVAYQGQAARYASSSDDNYFDNALRSQFDWALDRRNFVRAGYDYVRSHEPRGSTDRPIESSPDKYRLTTPYVTYAFGTPGAQGRVEVYYSDAMRRYLNNRTFTGMSDRDTQEYGGAFYWRVMPKTYLLAEGRETNIRYKASGSPLDADERRIYAGVSWEATAATTGTLKFGALKRDFKDESRKDFSGTSWEGLISWHPRTYSRFDFYTARQTNESTGLGNFILTSVGGVAWTHSWTSYLTTGVDLRYQRDAYQGFDRTDHTQQISLKTGYRFRRWLTLGAEFSRTHRDSNLDSFDYDRNYFLVTATAAM